jgi:hypothetical protein
MKERLSKLVEPGGIHRLAILAFKNSDRLSKSEGRSHLRRAGLGILLLRIEYYYRTRPYNLLKNGDRLC